MKQSVVIATNDPLVVNPLSQVLMKKDWCILITKSKIQSILNILDREIAFFVLDFELPNNSNIDLISIIKSIRPRLPIIVLSEDASFNTRRKLAKAGVFYQALKPIQVMEIEQIIGAIEELSSKEGEVNEEIAH